MPDDAFVDVIMFLLFASLIRRKMKLSMSCRSYSQQMQLH